MSVVPTDLEIARAARLRPIADVAEDLSIPPDLLEPWGPGVAKIGLEAIDRMGDPRAGYVVVTATTPTPFGEGKTTVSVGLAQALNRLGHPTAVALRQPSLGPTFGIKGGAAGGGRSQVVPMERLNLHLTGDFHAVTSATNLTAALIDAHLYHGNRCDIELHDVPWNRVLDVNDRALRNVTIGLGAKVDGVPRQSSFDITAASEVMAILALATDLDDLRTRLGRAVVAYDRSGKPVTADDIGAAGSMAVLLHEALQPNLMQTLEGTPAIIHAGPFANIAHGASSIVADAIAMRGADFVVTEAGFGADVGAEKFFNLKSRASGLEPAVAVVVTTVRGLKAQSGKHHIRAGRPLPDEMLEERPDEVTTGAENLRHHVGIVRRHGVQPVVAINAFPDDHASEHQAIAEVCEDLGVRHAVAYPHGGGGAGCEDLASEVRDAAAEGSSFEMLYPDDLPLKDKIERIATEVYGADGVVYEAKARTNLARFEDMGWGHLPICMAKTQMSISHDPNLKGAPKGWELPIRDVRASVGAGFILPLAGSIRTMPGLGSQPAAVSIDFDEAGEIVGLF